MPRVSQALHSFNGGEITPEVEGRTDVAKYVSSAKRIENFLVFPEGGIHRRPGTRFIKGAIDSTKKSRLIPFVFSTTQAYTLEFGDRKIRVFANYLQVGAATIVVTTDADTTEDEFSFENHGYINEQGPVHITATAGIPTGLAVDTDYWVVLPQAKTFVDADVNTGTEEITFGSDHEYSDEMGPFRLSTTGRLPTGLEGNLDYFIIRVSNTIIQLSLTKGGSAINITALTTGTHTLSPTGDYSRDKFRLASTQGGTPIDITVAGTQPHTFTPNPVGSPVGLPLEIVTPYTESELYDLHYVQSADFLFITHKNHRAIQLTRTGNTQWSLDFVNWFDGPYLAENTETTATIAVSASSGNNITLTLSVNTEFPAWDATRDIGRFVRVKNTGDWGFAEITGIQTPLIARATVRSNFTGLAASDTWRLGAWYTGNFPVTLSFSDQRLWYAGEANTPQTLRGSKTGGFNEFQPTDLDGTVVDTNSVSFQIGANQVNAIRWLGVTRLLYAGTPASVFIARASVQSEVITPTNITMPQMAANGVLSIQPITIGSQLLFVTRNSQRLLALQFDATVDEATPVDVTLLAKHIFGRTKTITTMAYQMDRQQILWLTRSDGELVAVTYIPDQEVFAWHRHIVGGSFGNGNAVVESVAVIPSPNETHDQLWLSVKRTINGATARHIEILEDEWLDDVATSMRFSDSSPVAYSGVATTTISGLDHLEGEVVQVLADGALHPDRTVSSGSITLDSSYTDVVVGLAYTSELETLNLEPPDPEGASMGKVARIDHLVLRLYNTIGGKIGPDKSNMDSLIFRKPADPMNESPPPFTGDIKASFRGPYTRKKNIVIRQDQALPFNLLSINVLMKTSER